MKINDLFCRGRRTAGKRRPGERFPPCPRHLFRGQGVPPRLIILQRHKLFEKAAARGGGRFAMTDKKSGAKLAAAGCAVGAVNGVFGGGGGMIVVPLLTGVGKKPPLVAHATAILVILPVCIASAAVYLANGWFDAELFVAVSIGMLAGGIAGAKLLGAVSPAAATLVFAAVMFAAGVRMLV